MKVLNYTGLQNLWTNIRNYITAHTPTKTSDLTNDSNFVDTSNSAVASGITSAKVTAYDSHIADTDIHVTTADKTKWNNQTYVFRYSSTVLVASSTNSNALLDNTDNLKVGDKVIDSSGVLFSVTAIDTVNSTFTVGTALIDLALDANVVHTSGNETVGGNKTFLSSPIIYNPDTSVNDYLVLKNPKATIGSTTDTGSQKVVFQDKNGTPLSSLISSVDSNGWTYTVLEGSSIDSQSNTITQSVRLRVTNTGAALLPSNNNSLLLGSASAKWASVYATNYYYGANNVEFSTKFVTTDTAQTISGNKTFSSNVNVYNSDATATTPNLYLRSSKIEISSQGNTSGDQNLTYSDRNNTTYAYIKGAIQSNGSAVKIRAIAKDSSDNSVVNELQMLAYTNGNKAIFPTYSNEIDLGVSSYKWKSFNGVEPSSLGMPDLSNAVDISSYITDLTGNPNAYSPPANGYIAIRSTTANVLGIVENTTGMGLYSRGTNQVLAVNLPVVKNSSITIYAICSSLSQAKFIPCQGNV